MMPADATAPRATWGHRPELDGLRTIAVYAVVLFHAGITWMRFGFVGVDVFFVLSGFLVTNVILTEHESTGRLNLRRFYARRVRRLLPAAIVTIVGVSVMSLLVEPRLVRLSFIDDARSALLYVANWHFLGSATDYFADDVQRSPFLHFWSLAIEEQFYIVFPMLLVGLLAFGRRRATRKVVLSGLAMLLLGSLVAQVVVASDNPIAAYYGTHARVYQLLAGALLAVVLRARHNRITDGRRRTVRLLAPLALVAVVALASIEFDLTPSIRGILATAATALLVTSLEFGNGSLLHRALSLSPVTYLGRISYATYLWHWPLIILTKPVLDLSPAALAALAIIGGTALAALSSELIETPIRRAPRLDRRPVTVVAVGLSCSLIAALVVVAPVLRDTRRPAIAHETSLSSAAISTADVAPLLAATPPAEINLDPTDLPKGLVSACPKSKPTDCIRHQGSSGRPHVHLIGDSNAQALIPAFTTLAEEHDFTFSANTRPGCPWQTGLIWQTDDKPLIEQCVRSRTDWYGTIIPALDPDIVVITHVARDPGSRLDATYLPQDTSDQRSLDEVVADATEQTLTALLSAGYRVVILEPLPYGDADPNNCLSGAATVGECAYQANTTPFVTEALYRRLADELTDVYSLDYDAVACPHLPVCIPYLDEQLVFRNQFHVSTGWLTSHRDTIWQLLVSTGVIS